MPRRMFRGKSCTIIPRIGCMFTPTEMRRAARRWAKYTSATRRGTKRSFSTTNYHAFPRYHLIFTTAELRTAARRYEAWQSQNRREKRRA
ncbi:MAG: hypothetical protein JRD89_01175 [Deltaproteobacteria bacterium]|nr:hypothetical protein [Deltaproteobacteria bacterium]